MSSPAQENAIEDYTVAVTEKIWKGIKNLPPSEQGEAFVRAFDIANDAFKTLIIQGSPLSAMGFEFAVMGGVIVVGLVLCRFLFRAIPGGR